MSLLISWLVLSFAFWLTAAVLPGVHVRSFGSAVLVAALFGVLNALIGWLFFAVFTIATLGIAYLLAFITRLIIDAIILKIVDGMTDRLTIDGFGWALAAAFLMALLGTLAEGLLRSLF